MQFEPQSPKEWLDAEFGRRRKKNPRYSLRMLAQRLDLPSGRLSELLSGRRCFTERLGIKIANRLALPPEERHRLLSLIRQARSGAPFSTGSRNSKNADSSFRQLSADAFHAIAEPHHFAILSLMETDHFSNDVRWMAQRLDLSSVEIRSAIERLERLGLLTEKNGKLVPTQKQLTTTHDIESAALQRSHKQSLEQAIETLDSVPVELRDITSMTMAIDLKRIPQAKAMIKKFRREVCDLLESGDSKSEVYNINIQLVPITRIQSQRKS